MSLVEQTLHSREVGLPNPNESHAAEQSYTNASPKSEGAAAPLFTTHRYSSYDETLRSEFYGMDDQVVMASKLNQPQSHAEAPVLPAKSALRASRLLDNLVGLKVMTASMDSPALSQTIPHDEYLSSEEEASSSAGDFSDFEYDSSSEISPSPTKDRRSIEDTARIVSVVFSGKPSVIDVPLSRRSISPSALERRQSMLDLSNIRPAPSSTRRLSISTISTTSTASLPPQYRPPHPPRVSSIPPSMQLSKQKPSFLQIDPYANGSSYSLEIQSPSKDTEEEEEERPKTPKTPTAMFRGVARTLSLLKKRSVPRLNQSLSPYGDSRVNQPLNQTSPSLSPYGEHTFLPGRSSYNLVETVPEVEQENETWEVPPPLPQQTPASPSPPVTYDEIVRAAKRKERRAQHSVARTPTPTMELPEVPSTPQSAPSAPARKGMTGFNAARRRMSIKLVGKF